MNYQYILRLMVLTRCLGITSMRIKLMIHYQYACVLCVACVYLENEHVAGAITYSTLWLEYSFELPLCISTYMNT